MRDSCGIRSKITLKDYLSIADIWVDIIDGNEMLTVFYKDNRLLEVYNPFCNCITDVAEYTYQLPLGLIDIFSDFEGTSYECRNKIEWLKMPIKD